MPELPDLTVYVEALDRFIGGKRVERIDLASPFLLRTYEPKLESFHGKMIEGFSLMGKRLVWHFEEDLHLVFHLMIAGRYQWRKAGAKPGKIGLCIFRFDHGDLLLTEASSRKRASLHAVAGRAGLHEFERDGIDVLASSEEEFKAALTKERHTIKRALTDPDILSGIGNAYSDEILHSACLSPFKRTDQLSDEEFLVLHSATRKVLTDWTSSLREEVGKGFPKKVTAFREGMAVHGRYEKPCPVCETPVQRIRYAANEANYCPTCQTGGKLLADRGLSRLMKDWPKSLEELENRKAALKKKFDDS